MGCYIIVALHPNTGFPIPVIQDNNEYDVAVYNTKEEAVAVAKKHSLCCARGFVVIPWEHYTIK